MDKNLLGVPKDPRGLNRVKQGKGQNKWILESTYPLMAAMLCVASGRIVQWFEIQVAKATNGQKNGSEEESTMEAL